MSRENSLTPPAAIPVSLEPETRERSVMGDVARRFVRNRLAVIGLGIVCFLIFTPLFGDVIAPSRYDEADFRIANELPFIAPAHVLGGDSIGRDYLTRLIYGARTSLLVGLSVPVLAFSIGLLLVASEGYLGGPIDFVVQRLVEIAPAIPPLLFALFLLSITGSGVGNVIFVLGITAWIEPTRLIRAQFMSFREREFVAAARSIGASNVRIALTHILPNALAPFLISFTFAIPLAIFAEAGLSFLGIGITEPTASCGKMVGAGIGTSIKVYYHLALFPTLFVALTMLGFSFVCDGLQEAFDPSPTR